MRKVILLSAVLAASVMQASAYDMYFKDGVTRTYRIYTDVLGPDDPPAVGSDMMRDAGEKDGYKVLELYWHSTAEDKDVVDSFIRVDGDRVYCSPDGSRDSWQLAYDFGMTAGQTGMFSFIGWNRDEETELVCDEIRPSSSTPGFEEMWMSRPDIENSSDYWIKGIGSARGNTDFRLSGIMGVGHHLMWVHDGDKMVYIAPAGIYVRDGARWVTRIGADGATVTTVLEQDSQNDGVLKVWRQTGDAPREHVVNARVDGQKVMFSLPSAPDDWRLAYDFCILPGETRRVYALEDGEFVGHDLRCDEINNLDTRSWLDEMCLTDLTVNEGRSDRSSQIRWIRGSGSTNGLLANVLPGQPADRVEAWAGNRMYFSVGTDALATVGAEPGRFTLDGLTLSAAGAGSVEVYTPDGRRVAAIVGAGSLTLPSPGLYIVRQGRRVTKLIAR